MLVPHLQHGGQNVIPSLLLHHHVIGEHAAIPANVFKCLGQIAVLATHPKPCVFWNIELAVLVGDHAVTPGLVVIAQALHRAIILRHMKINRPGPQGIRHFFQSFVGNKRDFGAL
jgi:hypothetical protein